MRTRTFLDTWTLQAGFGCTGGEIIRFELSQWPHCWTTMTLSSLVCLMRTKNFAAADGQVIWFASSQREQSACIQNFPTNVCRRRRWVTTRQSLRNSSWPIYSHGTFFIIRQTFRIVSILHEHLNFDIFNILARREQAGCKASGGKIRHGCTAGFFRR
jgi:hypothetical protein